MTGHLSAGQVSPGATHAHPIEHSHDRHAQIRLVVDGLLKQRFSSFDQNLSLSINRGIASLPGYRCRNLNSAGLCTVSKSRLEPSTLLLGDPRPHTPLIQRQTPLPLNDRKPVPAAEQTSIVHRILQISFRLW